MSKWLKQWFCEHRRNVRLANPVAHGVGPLRYAVEECLTCGKVYLVSERRTEQEGKA